MIKWFNNHGQALDKLQIEQIITYDSKSWTLILPVITRWTVPHDYLLLTWLLKVKAALTTCCSCHKLLLLGLGENETEAAEVLCTIADAGFGQMFTCTYAWQSLFTFWILIILPQLLQDTDCLAIAANIMQAAHTWLDHVFSVKVKSQVQSGRVFQKSS